MKTRTIVWGIAAILAIQGTAGAQARKNYLTLSGGLHHQNVSGSTEEYVLGSNDFPVVPAHNGVLLGLSYFRLGKKFGYEIDARFIGSSAVVMEDPSDGDTIGVTAGPHAALAVNALFVPLEGRFRPYLIVGGGSDVFLGGGKSYTSRFGYPIEMAAPKFVERFDLEAHVGAGLLIGVGQRWGFRFESRYGWIFDQDATLSGLSASGGVFFLF